MSEAMHSAGAMNQAIAGAPPDQVSTEREPRRARPRAPGVTWQEKLLPLMAGMVVALTAFFFVASFVQLYYLQSRIEQGPRLDLAPAMIAARDLETDLTRTATFDKDRFNTGFEYMQWRALLLLEANALQQRYHQAGVLLISRIWTRYLGFVTGMTLALVGAAFILGKLRESSSQLGTESAGWKVSITTASPGLILAVLGTVLMLATLATHLDMQVSDGPVFLTQQNAVQSERSPKPLVPEQNGKTPADTDILTRMKNEAASRK
jgi:hypothetical protein